jgi:hypothetical protein
MFKRIKEKWSQSHMHHIMQRSQTPAHCLYFAAVAIEAHGLYGFVAAILLVITLPEILEI